MTDAEIIEGLRRIGAEAAPAPPNFVRDLMKKIREDKGEGSMHDPDICRHLNTEREWTIRFEFTEEGQSEAAALGNIECTLNEAAMSLDNNRLLKLLKECQIVTDGGTQSYSRCCDCGQLWTKEMPVTEEDVTANTQAHQPD